MNFFKKYGKRIRHESDLNAKPWNRILSPTIRLFIGFLPIVAQTKCIEKLGTTKSHFLLRFHNINMILISRKHIISNRKYIIKFKICNIEIKAASPPHIVSSLLRVGPSCLDRILLFLMSFRRFWSLDINRET